MIHPARTALHFSNFMIMVLVTLLGAACGPAFAAESETPSAVVMQAGAGPDAPLTIAKEKPLPDQYGMLAEYGYTYDPQQNISFMLARVFAIYDYGTVWRQDRTKTMRFKVEAALGSTLTPGQELMASANMLALFYYPAKFKDRLFRPYVEAGIGVIYTGFRVKGQGLHYNFNPLLGIGLELPQEEGKNFIVAIRLHHLSNAGIDRQNRGVNSVGLQIGRFF
ncbi:MAG TPA: acyloxyacyl hydrolase [Desulfuromonadaceae bacterium]|jgi:hypothetical protein